MEHREMPQSSAIQTPRRWSFSAAPHRTGKIRWIHAVGIWLSRRHAYRDLNSLDDRLLDDVGIPREIVRQLGKPPWWP
jgi:uncharacterized protein YjiS (DUF1127 family)